MLRPVYLFPAFLAAWLSARPVPAQPRRVMLWQAGNQYEAPLPDAVRAAYRRLPVAGRTHEDWKILALKTRRQPADTLYEVRYTVAHLHGADSVFYPGFASFTSQGQQRGSTRELPIDSLPWRARWRVRYDQESRWLRRQQPGIVPALVVAQLDPCARRPRVSYTVVFGRSATTKALLSAWALRAQGRRVVLWYGESDPDETPLPNAVRAAYGRLPIAGRTHDSWSALVPNTRRQPADTLYEVRYKVARPGLVDSVSYWGSASFTSRGQQRGSTRELPANSLPWRVRWHLYFDSRRLRREHPGIVPTLVVVQHDPYAGFRGHRVLYTIEFQLVGANDFWPTTFYEYYGNGLHPPAVKFRN